MGIKNYVSNILPSKIFCSKKDEPEMPLDDIEYIKKYLLGNESGANLIGKGSKKTGYLFKDKDGKEIVILKIEDVSVDKDFGSKRNEYNASRILKRFNEKQTKTHYLREYGIQTPQLIKAIVLPDKKGTYSYFEEQEKAPGEQIQIEKPNSDSVTPEQLKEIDKRNIEFTKHRILTGKKHLRKFGRDAIALTEIQAFQDCHGEQIFYDEEKGYTFIDLTTSSTPDFQSKKDLVARINEACSKKYKDGSYSIYWTAQKFLNAILFGYFTEDSTPSCFEQKVLNGILKQQAIGELKKEFSKFENMIDALNHLENKSSQTSLTKDQLKLLDIYLKNKNVYANNPKFESDAKASLKLPENVKIENLLDCDFFEKAYESLSQKTINDNDSNAKIPEHSILNNSGNPSINEEVPRSESDSSAITNEEVSSLNSSPNSSINNDSTNDSSFNNGLSEGVVMQNDDITM